MTVDYNNEHQTNLLVLVRILFIGVAFIDELLLTPENKKKSVENIFLEKKDQLIVCDTKD